MSVTDISKEIGAMWKTLSSEEKVPYEQMAKEDKERLVVIILFEVYSCDYNYYYCIDTQGRWLPTKRSQAQQLTMILIA